MKFLAAIFALGLACLGKAADLPDPMRPPAVAHAVGVAEAKPILSAVIGTQGDRIAIFNGQIVRRGGSVGSYAIESIFENGVRFRHAGLTQELYLPRTVILKKPSSAAAPLPMGVH